MVSDCSTLNVADGGEGRWGTRRNSESSSHYSEQNRVKHLFALLVGSVFVPVADLTLPTLKDPCPGHLGIQGMMGNVVLAASPGSASGSPLGGVAVSAVASGRTLASAAGLWPLWRCVLWRCFHWQIHTEYSHSKTNFKFLFNGIEMIMKSLLTSSWIHHLRSGWSTEYVFLLYINLLLEAYNKIEWLII